MTDATERIQSIYPENERERRLVDHFLAHVYRYTGSRSDLGCDLLAAIRKLPELAPAATESDREIAHKIAGGNCYWRGGWIESLHSNICNEVCAALAAVRQAARARAFDDAAHIYSSLMSEAEKIEAIRALKDKP